jgi:hypothetical protein
MFIVKEHGSLFKAYVSDLVMILYRSKYVAGVHQNAVYCAVCKYCPANICVRDCTKYIITLREVRSLVLSPSRYTYGFPIVIEVAGLPVASCISYVLRHIVLGLLTVPLIPDKYLSAYECTLSK